MVTTASCLVKIQVSGSSSFYVDLRPESLEVIYGTRDASNPFNSGTKAEVLKIKVHHNYVTSQAVHDVALIQIQDIPLSSSVKPVCLPGATTGELDDDTAVYVTGYGQSSATEQGFLKEIKAIKIAYDMCKEFYYSSLPPKYGIFCATPAVANEDTCSGDGGAPAVTYHAASGVFTLVGLNFGGSSDCSGSMVSTDISPISLVMNGVYAQSQKRIKIENSFLPLAF